MSIRDLIAAAYNKDATAFESAFQSVMQDKVSAAVENAFTAEEVEEDLDEEVEELDELSKNTVRNYYNKAGEQGRDITGKMMVGGGDWSKDGKDTDTLKKRAAGRMMALKRRSGEVKMSEEVELDEVSASTLGSYIRKSSKDFETSMKKRDAAIDDSDRDTARAMGMRARKRGLGTDMAVDKLKGNRYVKVPAAIKMSEEHDGHVSASYDYMPDDDKRPSRKEITNHAHEYGGDSIKIQRIDHGGPAGGASEVQISGHPKHVMKLMNHHHDENYSLDHAGHAAFVKDYR